MSASIKTTFSVRGNVQKTRAKQTPYCHVCNELKRADNHHSTPPYSIPTKTRIETVDNTNLREKRDLLTLKYGSKQKKRALAAKMTSAISAEALSNMVNIAVTQVKQSAAENLESSTVGQDKSAEDDVGATTKRMSAVLPSFNPQATSPGEIYDLSDIVSPDDMILLTEESTAFAELNQNDRKSLGGFPSLILDLCQNLPSQIEARRTRCVYILYLNYMIKLFKLGSGKRDFSSADLEKLHVPKEVCKLLLNRYTSAATGKRAYGRRTMSNADKDKLLSRCVVLLLSLNQFMFSMSKFLSEVPSTDQKLTPICRLLGCKVKKSAQTGEKSVMLQSPPKKQTISFSNRKKWGH